MIRYHRSLNHKLCRQGIGGRCITDFGGFTHHNVHIRFWKAFEKFVAEGEPTQMQTSEQNLREKLQQARFSPKLIIHVPKGFPAFAEGKQFEISQRSSDHLKNMDAATVQEYFLTGIETPTVKNYDKAFVARAVAKMTGTSSVSAQCGAVAGNSYPRGRRRGK
jgi:hypothetical protein